MFSFTGSFKHSNVIGSFVVLEADWSNEPQTEEEGPSNKNDFLRRINFVREMCFEQSKLYFNNSGTRRQHLSAEGKC
ncbi:MAG: hypothetical protein ACTS5P_00500 [Candidatus Hodgkinia cicadicola]